MKTSIFKKCAIGVSLLLPMGGVAFAGAQALGAGVAGADTIGTFCFQSSSTVTIDVPGASTTTVDLTSGTDAADDGPGCVQYDEDTGLSTSAFTIDSGNISPSGFVDSVTIPAGDIETDASTVMIFTDSGAGGATSAVLGSAFPGCTLEGLLTTPAPGTDDIELDGSGGVLSGGPVTKYGITVGGASCSPANVSYLDSQVSQGVTISAGVTI